MRAEMIFLFFVTPLCILAGCSKSPPRFEDARIEMTLQDFKARYPNALKVAEAKGTDGEPYSLFQRAPTTKMKKAEYYFSKDQLVGIIILFSKAAEFDSIVDALTAANGEPKEQFIMANSKAAVWDRKNYFINMIQGATETEIKLPTGIAHKLAPGDIVVMIGRKEK